MCACVCSGTRVPKMKQGKRFGRWESTTQSRVDSRAGDTGAGTRGKARRGDPGGPMAQSFILCQTFKALATCWLFPKQGEARMKYHLPRHPSAGSFPSITFVSPAGTGAGLGCSPPLRAVVRERLGVCVSPAKMCSMF